MDNLTDIAVFVRVVEADSFTAAAANLGLSRSVVSKYITRLERRLGVRLLNRSTRRLGLTEAGARFFHQSQLALAQLDEAQNEMQALQAAPRGLLRISAPASFGALHLAPMLPEFRHSCPGLSIDLAIDDRQVDLVDTGIDIAIRIADLPDSSLVAKRIAACRYVVCAAPGYLDRFGRPEVPADLQRHNCLLFSHWQTPNQWRFLDRSRSYVSVQVRGDVVCNSSLALREILLAGGGLSMAPSFLVGADIADGRLEPVLSEFSLRELSIYAVYPHRELLAAKVRAFLEFLSARIDSENPYWDHNERKKSG